jgi:hypothetical protein
MLLLIPCDGVWPRTIRWNALAGALGDSASVGGGLGVLVIIFGPPPDDLGGHPGGIAPNLLLQALNADMQSSSSAELPLLWVSAEDAHERIWAGASRIPLIAKDKYDDASCLCRLSRMAVAADEDVRGLFELARDPQEYRIGQLHSLRNCQDLDEKKRDITLMEARLGRVRVPPSLELNVLIVENDFDNWCSFMKAEGVENKELDARSPFQALPKANFYLYPQEFGKLLADLAESGGSQAILNVQKLGCSSGSLEKNGVQATLKCSDIDLVLLDVRLRERGGASRREITGLTLAPYFLSACPQALLFLFTAMDVEILAGSGDVDWQYIDGILSKRHLGSLWYRYQDAFGTVFGRSLWPVFVASLKRGQNRATLTDREAVRQLLGSLRQWRKEPHILTYGQGVPEMIDHADRHTGMVWDLVDRFVSTLCENATPAPCYLRYEDRMYLAMAAWLHDIGHRGDPHCADPITVRNNHAAISEYLILRNPDAFRLGWLKELMLANQVCAGPNRSNEGTDSEPRRKKTEKGREEIDKARQARLQCRNTEYARVSCGEGLCPLRLLGLLCRHHQSNSPLCSEAFPEIRKKGKEISPYARVRMPDGGQRDADLGQRDADLGQRDADLKEWMRDDEPLHGWTGSKVMCLADFMPSEDGLNDRFLMLSGLLRLLDGIQLHRSRVGSQVCIGSFGEFLDTRGRYTDILLDRYDRVLQSSAPGSAAYAEVLKQRMKLDPYARLLRVQHVHYWRQMSVHSVTTSWSWDKDGGGCVTVGYLLDDLGLAALNEIKPVVSVSGEDEQFELGHELRKKVAKNCLDKFRDDAIRLAEALGCDSIKTAVLSKSPQERLAESLKESNEFVWGMHVLDELITSEVEGQTFDGSIDGSMPPAFGRCLPLGVTFRILLRGKLSKPTTATACLWPRAPKFRLETGGTAPKDE